MRHRRKGERPIFDLPREELVRQIHGWKTASSRDRPHHGGAAGHKDRIRKSSRRRAPRNRAALDPHARFGERRRGRLLQESVENDSGSECNDADHKACNDERAHRIFSLSFRN
jgi:hypothetical protein